MEIEGGGTNVYADLGRPDADEMLSRRSLQQRSVKLSSGAG